ncbi:hypothetical protein CYMTET_33253 [Cymbomonas tetramitiformis]|uniref:Uncharacterized protein n=1 Tax=Cymbomonas tetramitiformis TaxID=36881 RepID=A0AAE0KR52_9CHLO|nr:hypothetical protein CYMTET_33253 [Cymbomonas tetramitiformis]
MEEPLPSMEEDPDEETPTSPDSSETTGDPQRSHPSKPCWQTTGDPQRSHLKALLCQTTGDPSASHPSKPCCQTTGEPLTVRPPKLTLLSDHWRPSAVTPQSPCCQTTGNPQRSPSKPYLQTTGKPSAVTPQNPAVRPLAIPSTQSPLKALLSDHWQPPAQSPLKALLSDHWQPPAQSPLKALLSDHWRPPAQSLCGRSACGKGLSECAPCCLAESCNTTKGGAKPVPIAGPEVDPSSAGQGSKLPQSWNTQVQEVELTPAIQTEPSDQQLGAESQEHDSPTSPPKRVSELPARTSLAVQSKPGRVTQVLGEAPPPPPAAKKASELFADGKPPPPMRVSQKFAARMSQQQAEGIPPPGRVSKRISGLTPGNVDLRNMLSMASDDEPPSSKTTRASFFQDKASLAGTAPQTSVEQPSNGSAQSEVKTSSQQDPVEDDNNSWKVRKANMRQKYQSGTRM